jgi:hypothetical protein
MTPSAAELAEERRRGRIAGPATIAAGVLIAVGTFWSLIVNRDRPSGDAESLRFFHDHASEQVAASIIRAVGFLALILTIVHLQRVTKARNPALPTVLFVLGLFGCVAFAAGTVGQAVALRSEANDFVTQSFSSAHVADEAAKDAARETWPLVTGIAAFAGTLALAFWFVLGSLNAMRVGLLTRFTGVLGIIVGPGFVFGFAPPVMVFWLIAVGVLFLGHWPRGLPPAWESGEARPWPGREVAEEQPAAEELESAGGTRNGEVEAVGPGVRKTDGDSEAAARPSSPRRKRKRRD